MLFMRGERVGGRNYTSRFKKIEPYTRTQRTDRLRERERDLFISRCQNHTKTNHAPTQNNFGHTAKSKSELVAPGTGHPPQ